MRGAKVAVRLALMIWLVALPVAAVCFVSGAWLIATDGHRRHRSEPLADRLMRHQPIAVQAEVWLRQQGDEN